MRRRQQPAPIHSPPALHTELAGKALAGGACLRLGKDFFAPDHNYFPTRPTNSDVLHTVGNPPLKPQAPIAITH